MNGRELAAFKKALRQQPCANCGWPPGDPDPAWRIEADHIISVHRAHEFGLTEADADTNPENFQPLCGKCNRYKESWTHAELRARRFIQWRQMGEVPFGQPVPWPPGFDWDTGEWVDQALSDADEATARDLLVTRGLAAWREFRESRPLVERRTKTDWVRGMLFDYPVRPEDRSG